MVGYGGNMASHGADRIYQAGSVLDFHALHPVGVIGNPALGSIIQDARVKPGAAAGAGFNQNMGEIPGEPLLQFIDSQYLPVVHGSLVPRIPAR